MITKNNIIKVVMTTWDNAVRVCTAHGEYVFTDDTVPKVVKDWMKQHTDKCTTREMFWWN